MTVAALPLALLLSAPAHADDVDGKQEGSDIVATGIVHAPPEVVSPRLADLDEVILVAPETCMRRWEVGPDVAGVGATFEVTYLLEAFRRRLKGTVTKDEVGRLVEWDHAGNRGFVTRWSFEAVEGGTQVRAHTFIMAPPRPLRRYYTNRVQPAWVACYEELIQALDARISATWSPPPAPLPEAPSPDSADEPAVPDESGEPPRP